MRNIKIRDLRPGDVFSWSPDHTPCLCISIRPYVDGLDPVLSRWLTVYYVRRNMLKHQVTDSTAFYNQNIELYMSIDELC